MAQIAATTASHNRRDLAANARPAVGSDRDQSHQRSWLKAYAMPAYVQHAARIRRNADATD